MKKTIATILSVTVFGFHILCFDIVSAAAQGRKPVLGMLTLEAQGGLSDKEAATISDRLQEHLVRTGVFEVAERGKIMELLKEQGIQQSGVCNTAECAVKVGEIIGAEQMVTGSIGMVGKTYAFSVRVVDVSTSRVLKAVSRDYEGPIEKLLTQVALDVAREIAGLSTAKRGSKTWIWAVAGGVIAAGGGSAAIFLKGKTTPPSEIPLPPKHP